MRANKEAPQELTVPNPTYESMESRRPLAARSAPELWLDTLSLAERSFCAWMEIEAHIKDAENQIRAIRTMIGDFKLRVSRDLR